MRTISAQAITDTVARLCIEANTRLPKDVEAALAKARAEEPWPLAKNTLDLLWSNLSAAKEENLPICQDTGMACVFVELGTDVHIDGHFEGATVMVQPSPSTRCTVMAAGVLSPVLPRRSGSATMLLRR